MEHGKEQEVWARVMSRKSDDPELKRLISELRQAAGMYRRLSQRGNAGLAQQLSGLAQQTVRDARALETVCYVQTGQRLPQQPQEPIPQSLCAALRQAHLAALDRAHRLSVRGGDYAAQFRSLSEAEQRRAESLRQLLQQAL